MSSETRDTNASFSIDAISVPRAVALVGVLVLTWSYVSVLYYVTNVVGGSSQLLFVVVGSLALATLVGSFVSVRTALGVTAVLLVGGFTVYVFTLPQSQLELLTPARLLSDTVALLTGLSILRLTGAGVWAMAVAPGPVFLSWYLAVRRQYVWGVAVGGVALGLFVLTSDAGQLTTLVGVAGGTVTVAASTFERYGAGIAQLDVMSMVLAAMIVLAATISVVPGAEGSPLLPDRGSPTVEGSLVNSPDRLNIVGSIRLSPNVRFTVNSPQSSYWETAAYDRYTGDGWIRTGSTDPYNGRLRGPVGASQTVQQQVTAKGTISILPAAWKPVRIDGPLASEAEVTAQGNLRPTTSLREGESYRVTSEVPIYTTAQLRRSGTNYPDDIEAAYLQLPDSTSDRVRARAAAVTADADNPYDKAVAIEQTLEAEKRYSLSVPQPSGDIADSFLFEMDAGYCTYYATTMVVMLRSQGVPARFVTGYTPGQQVSENEYVVRGLDSHAWVEVYFEDVGWVRFDPTPSGPRQTAENARVAEARQNGEPNVDVGGSEETATPTPTPTTTTAANGTEDDTNNTPTPSDALEPSGSGVNATPPPGSVPGLGSSVTSAGGGLSGPDLPPQRTFALGLVALIGLVAGARRTGVTERAYRALWLRYQGTRRTPEDDTIRAYRRLEYVLERRYRPRRTGETPRTYLQSLSRVGLDADVARVGEAYERARYGDGVARETADDAIATVDRLVRETTPLLGRLSQR
ncbi:transglutaminase-like enzyme, cysteine protease [Halogeometricum borinquense DSM 11551]|uniref:Transglutaminase-like enzyme, cysteine protease n=1 Tax=Halogeometricum borinquense (strain ATCC 700274 / DSM 11551 / JCM 10706 / KCTC 4070 / PR3) TaxID=469382 RepID=E4NM42_HALBP|nr:transglutaminase domain-containing protein [Halogeometricum borinquense]ADQ66141.1 transglutaminase-like enzyme, predicted cysteine protease [Halogeometricum borinquense DSM 11551]ELY27364.1 transglutaminase-like enzyme, cysteine protease [Halogeometricum borinquense DSM 11551]